MVLLLKSDQNLGFDGLGSLGGAELVECRKMWEEMLSLVAEKFAEIA